MVVEGVTVHSGTFSWFPSFSSHTHTADIHYFSLLTPAFLLLIYIIILFLILL